MASVIEIANRALQRLGATRLVSLTENSRTARSVNAVYESARDAELRAHPWNFAVRRAQLAEDVTAPVFGPAHSYTLPADFLKLLPPDAGWHYNDLDWKIEGRSVLTDEVAPLNIRYIARITDANTMDALFREALAMRMAKEMCEELTNSNNKIAAINADYRDAILEARRANAFDRVSDEPPEDSWLSVRN